MFEGKARHWRTSKYPLRIIIRACFLSYMLLSAMLLPWVNLVMDRTPKVNANGFEYLTVLGFLGTLLVMAVSVVTEFYEKLRPIKVALAFMFLVVEAMITFLYWGMYIFLGHKFISGLNVPPPLYLDFAAHLMPLLYLIFECFYSRSYGRHLYDTRTTQLVLIPVFTLSYFCWITYLFWQTPDDLPYRFLREIPLEGRVVFSVVSTVLSLYLYGMVMNVYVQFYRQNQEQKQQQPGEDDGSDYDDEDSEMDNEDLPDWLRRPIK